MAIVLKGTAWPSGQIQFSRADNEWAFARIQEGMKKGQENSIRVNPKIASFDLVAGAARERKDEVTWQAEVLELLQSADLVYLEHHDGYLRFRRAVHECGKSKFITFGSQDEVNNFASTTLAKVKYFFALRRDASSFALDMVVDFGAKKAKLDFPPIEIPGRMEIIAGRPVIAFSGSGSTAPVEVVEWRSKVKVGDRGRFHSDTSPVNIHIAHYTRPFTIFCEHREEFGNFSYNFDSGKFQKKLEKLIKKKLADIAMSE